MGIKYKETEMRKAVVLLIAFGLFVAFSGLALAGGGDGSFCAYSSHAKQVSAEKTDTAKTVATKTAPKAESNKLALAHQDNAKKLQADQKK